MTSLSPITTEHNTPRRSWLDAYTECRDAVAAVRGIPADRCILPKTWRTIHELDHMRSRADEAIAYRAMTGDKVGAELYLSGWSMAAVIAQTMKYQRKHDHECECDGLGDACPVCKSKSNPDDEYPFDEFSKAVREI